MRRILKSVREYKWPTLLTVLLMIGEALIETQIPTRTADLVNGIKAGMAMDEVAKIGLSLFGMALISLCCGGLGGFTCAKASAGFAKNLRHDAYGKIQDFSFENVDKFSSSSLVTRLTTDITNIQMSYMMLSRSVIRSPMMFVFSIIMAYRMSKELAITFVVIVPILLFGLIMIGILALPAFKRVFRKYDKLNESIEENIRGMRVVKGFAREKHEVDKFDSAAENIRKDFTFAERVVAMNSPVMQICLNFNMLFVLYLGSKLVVTTMGKELDVGQISAMLTYAMQVLMSLMMLSVVFVMITISLESIKRVSEVLAEKPVLTNPENPVTSVADGSVDFDGVSFKYSEKAKRYSIQQADIHIPSGATVGIIGGTGVGKSSLVQLIPRLYDATEGSVKVGGINVKDYDLTTLRDSVAMVLQKNLIFSGTIKDNLRWGNPDATDEEIKEACKLACADEFIVGFPDGYDTWIEQGGNNVSGGQKQRLCIARALLKKPKILILDDSTSAVDTKTDAQIRAALAGFIPDTTKIIIAQRISSVQDSDMIIVMDNGMITDIGTHDELLAKSEIYREVYEQQTRGGDEDAE